MDAQGFKKYFKDKLTGLSGYIENGDAAAVAGREAAEFFKENFQAQGFKNSGVQKWKEVQRRTNPKNFKVATRGKYKGQPRAKNAKVSLPILTGTGALGRSIQYKVVGKGKAIIYSDLPYARVHNEGLKAGRGKGFIMPKRQFVGQSKELSERIDKKLKQRVKEIFKQ
jgi:phage gpG-like protein